MARAWDYVKKARDVWPPDLEKILKLYDNAIAVDSSYYLIYKDRARLFFILNDLEKSKQNYLLWKGLDKIWDKEVQDEMKLREKRAYYKIHPWENHREYFEKNHIKNKNFVRQIPRELNHDKQKNDADLTIERLERIKEEFNKKLEIIDLEIEELHKKVIREQISIEKEREKSYEKKWFTKIFNRFSKKNKLLKQQTENFFIKKNIELEKVKEDCEKKEFEKRKFTIEISKILQEIENYRRTSSEINKENKKLNSPIDEEKEIKTFKQKEKSLCKGICQKFRVKKIRGSGRYESEQVHCQTCDVWIDYRGCHSKNGKPAKEETRGLRCNCCNFQVRTKPRGKKYKEKISATNLDPADHDEDMGNFTMEEYSKTTKESEIDKINKLIVRALWLIEKNSAGIYEHVLQQELRVSDREFEQILPRLLRLDNIVENVEGEGIHKRKFLRSNIHDKISKEKSNDPRQELEIPPQQVGNIGHLALKMVEDHIRWKNNINIELKRELIFAYQKENSLEKLFEKYPNITKEKIRQHLFTDLRLPLSLKKVENEGGLHPNPTCSIVIALYATDYFNWDGKKENEREILELAKSLSYYLKKDNSLDLKFRGKKVKIT